MKSVTIVPALLIAVASLFSPSIAEASCHNICVRAYRACLATDWPEDDCLAELGECTTACGGPLPISGELVLKDDVSAQSCVIERSESTAAPARLALRAEPANRADIRASQVR